MLLRLSSRLFYTTNYAMDDAISFSILTKKLETICKGWVSKQSGCTNNNAEQIKRE